MKIDRKLIASAAAAMLLVATFAVPVAAALRADVSNSVTQDPAPPSDAERAMFTQGQNLFLQGSYTRSTEVLEQFLNTYPQSILTDLTLLWLGRSYLKLGKFKEAEDVGKRLHAISDTPFADIYDTEVRTAVREATQQSESNTVRHPFAAPKPISASSTPASGRNRFAKTPIKSPSTAATSAKNKATTTGNRARVAPKEKRKSTELAKRAGSGGTRPQSGQAAAAKQKRPATVASNKRGAGSSAKLKPRVVTSAAGKNLKAASNSTASISRKNVAKAKPAANRSATTGGAGRRSGTLVINRAPSKNAVKSASSKPSGTKHNRLASNSNRSNQPPARPAAPQSTTPADLLAPSAVDVERAPVVNAHAATGGLYSMIDAGLSSAAPQAAPANTAPASDTRVDAKLKGMNAKPGETIYLSFVIRNYGSIRQTYELRVTAPGAPEAQLFVDSNGDGQHQSDELRVTGSPVVELKNSEVPFLLQITIPRTASEGQQYSYTVTVISFGSGEVVARTTSTLTVSSIRANLVPMNNPESSRPSLAR